MVRYLKYKNQIEFRLWGKYALFTDPLTKTGGEKYSYPVPTYQALKGIVESIYWKPTLTWIIDEVRIMKQIRTQKHGIRTLKYQNDESDLFNYSYLSDVEYQVRAHFEWNENRPDLANDRNEHKHYLIAKRMLERGGRRDIFLGTRECQGYVEPCNFGEGKGDYDDVTMSFGLMFHGFTYPDEAYNDETRNSLTARFWHVIMQNGVIKFIRPEECTILRKIDSMESKDFVWGKNFIGLEEFEDWR